MYDKIIWFQYEKMRRRNGFIRPKLSKIFNIEKWHEKILEMILSKYEKPEDVKEK